MLACLACTLFSCGPDELLPEPVPPVVKPGDNDKPGEEPEEKPEEPAKIQLGITAALQNMQQTRGIIEAFAPGHEMGIFVSTNQGDEATGTKNASYLFDGKVWNAGQDVPVEADADVVAYLPYDRGVTDFKDVPFDLADQNDILYGTAKVTKDVPDGDPDDATRHDTGTCTPDKERVYGHRACFGYDVRRRIYIGNGGCVNRKRENKL